MALTQSFIDVLFLRDGHVFVFGGSAQINLDIADSLLLYDAYEQGVGSARLTQEPVEMVILPTDANARLTQEPIEMVILPTAANARLTQMPIEIIAQKPAASLTGSQIELRID